MRLWWCVLFLCALAFLLGCSGDGVEIGNPSEPPKVQGQFQVMLAEAHNIQYDITIHDDGTVSAERMMNQVSEDASSASCIESDTLVIVEAAFADGEEMRLTFQLDDSDLIETVTVAIDDEPTEATVTDVDSGETFTTTLSE